jgi:hypothetical protein
MTTGHNASMAARQPESGAGVDRTLLRRNLSLTPEERLKQMIQWQHWIVAHWGTARPPAAERTDEDQAERP